jgi:hypothetical protein
MTSFITPSIPRLANLGWASVSRAVVASMSGLGLLAASANSGSTAAARRLHT